MKPTNTIDIYRQSRLIGSVERQDTTGQAFDPESTREVLIADEEWPDDIHVELRRFPTIPNHA